MPDAFRPSATRSTASTTPKRGSVRIAVSSPRASSDSRAGSRVRRPVVLIHGTLTFTPEQEDARGEDDDEVCDPLLPFAEDQPPEEADRRALRRDVGSGL